MFKDTCLIVLKRKDRSPHILYLENLHILAIEIFVHLDLEVFVHQLRNDSSNAQAYNHTNATIIRIKIPLRERGCDYENFGARIT
jgi:hypothetical protein